MIEQQLLRFFELWWPVVATVVAILALSALIDRLYARNKKVPARDNRLRRQIAKVGLNIVAIISLVLVVPLASDTQQQLLSLVGIVITAMLTLSSTTFVSNGMAGIMLRSVTEFNPGDFIRIGNHFGRITELGLLHTEIQTEDSDLSTLPNLYLITHPFSVVRSHGTIISADVSLGYDVGRKKIEEALLEAATNCGLTDSFVQITSLADHAVCYRISGKLAEVKQIISARSNLHKHILDALHTAKIEIVSPSFMNQRPIGEQVFIPTHDHAKQEEAEVVAEDVIFDKADLVETIDDLKQEQISLTKRKEKLEKLLANGDTNKKAAYQFRLDYTTQRLNGVEAMLAAQQVK